MSLEIEATYENGILKPANELPLQEGQKVSIIIQPRSGQPQGGAVRRLSGLIPWPGDREELRRYLNDPDEGVPGNHDV